MFVLSLVCTDGLTFSGESEIGHWELFFFSFFF